jgi:hypothetical protein
MRINNDNMSGVAGASIAPRAVARTGKTAPATSEDSVALGFIARFSETPSEPSAVEKALTLAVRDGSYDPQPSEIAAALVGKAFDR